MAEKEIDPKLPGKDEPAAGTRKAETRDLPKKQRIVPKKQRIVPKKQRIVPKKQRLG
jgi:hypothetical protein